MLRSRITVIALCCLLSIRHPGVLFCSAMSTSTLLPKFDRRSKTSIDVKESTATNSGNKRTETDNDYELRVRRVTDGVMSHEGTNQIRNFSAPCRLLPWTEWTPCNATCNNRVGQQTRRRYLALQDEWTQCDHLVNTMKERDGISVIEQRVCGPTDGECDPVTICGEGRKDGIPCGMKMKQYYYSVVEHRCLPFEYLGCKGGRNRFSTKEDCEATCVKTVEKLPSWRREQMAALQNHASEIASDGTEFQEKKIMKSAEHCSQPVDPGTKCKNGTDRMTTAWYYSPRASRCFEFVYLGCRGNLNRYADYSSCMADCMPEEKEKSLQVTTALAGTDKNVKYQENISSPEVAEGSFAGNAKKGVIVIFPNHVMRDPDQDCILTEWGPWCPCTSTQPHIWGTQRRWRYPIKYAGPGGLPCGEFFEDRKCVGCC